MQGKKKYNKQLSVFVNIEDLIPDNHYLRKINKIFDISFVRELTAECYSQRYGRPSIDPEVYFRMMVIGYLYEIEHDRKLCEEIKYNIAYRWYCRLHLDDSVPEHSSLSRIRDRYGHEIFKRFFDKIISLCQKHGLIKGNRVMTDSSLFKADASIDSIVAKDKELANQEREKILNRNVNDPMPKRTIKNDTHVSMSDPDSTLARKEGTPRGLKYKMHTTIDADSRVVLSSRITTGATHDTKIFIEQIKSIKSDYNLNITEAIADRGYGAIDNIKQLHNMGITTYIPLFNTKVGKKVLDIIAAGFRYDKKENKYICPAGKDLLPIKSDTMAHYYSKSNICNNCKIKNHCVANKNKRGHRIIHKNLDQELVEVEIHRMQTNVFQQKLADRMWKIEGVFAEAKNRHTFSRAKYRGLAKVQIQAYMVSAVQNLKRILYCLFHVIQRFISCLVYNFECYFHYLLVNHYFYCLG